MTYEDYCKIEGLETGLETTPAEKKAYQAGQHDVAHDIASCFGISTCFKDEKRFLLRLQKVADMEIVK